MQATLAVCADPVAVAAVPGAVVPEGEFAGLAEAVAAERGRIEIVGQLDIPAAGDVEGGGDHAVGSAAARKAAGKRPATTDALATGSGVVPSLSRDRPAPGGKGKGHMSTHPTVYTTEFGEFPIPPEFYEERSDQVHMSEDAATELVECIGWLPARYEVESLLAVKVSRGERCSYFLTKIKGIVLDTEAHWFRGWWAATRGHRRGWATPGAQWLPMVEELVCQYAGMGDLLRTRLEEVSSRKSTPAAVPQKRKLPTMSRIPAKKPRAQPAAEAPAAGTDADGSGSSGESGTRSRADSLLLFYTVDCGFVAVSLFWGGSRCRCRDVGIVCTAPSSGGLWGPSAG